MGRLPRMTSLRPLRRSELIAAMERAERDLRAIASDTSLPAWSRMRMIAVANGLSVALRRAKRPPRRARCDAYARRCLCDAAEIVAQIRDLCAEASA